EFDHPVVAGVGDVDVAIRHVDGDVAGLVELAGATARGSEVLREPVATEGGEYDIAAEGGTGGVDGDDAVVVDRVHFEPADVEAEALGAARRAVVGPGRGGGFGAVRVVRTVFEVVVDVLADPGVGGVQLCLGRGDFRRRFGGEVLHRGQRFEALVFTV